MTSSPRTQMAALKAQALIQELKIKSLPINPISIAEEKGIVVQAKPDTEDGVSGMLLRQGNTFGILYATHVPSEGFQRFSVAHELGHYFLEGHIDQVLSEDGIHSSRAGFISSDPYELEADQFASGLLMPSALFRRAMAEQEASLGAVEDMAKTCLTSLTATAIRYAQLSEEAIAVVVSSGNKVEYAFLSNTMKSLREFSWPRKGSIIPKDTATASFNADPDRVANSDRADAEIDIVDWLGGNQKCEAIEEVIGLGRYGKTLTVLTCPTMVEETYQDSDEDDEDEKDLIERWTPRFRR